MADLNAWSVAALGLLAPWAACVSMILRGGPGDRLVVLQVATALTVFMLMLLAMAVDQPSFLDLALAVALVGYPGTLIYTHVLERWL